MILDLSPRQLNSLLSFSRMRSMNCRNPQVCIQSDANASSSTGGKSQRAYILHFIIVAKRWVRGSSDDFNNRANV
jgi:hypothetical protein